MLCGHPCAKGRVIGLVLEGILYSSTSPYFLFGEYGPELCIEFVLADLDN